MTKLETNDNVVPMATFLRKLEDARQRRKLAEETRRYHKLICDAYRCLPEVRRVGIFDVKYTWSSRDAYRRFHEALRDAVEMLRHSAKDDEARKQYDDMWKILDATCKRIETGRRFER
jgi:hypothetical protein